MERFCKVCQTLGSNLVMGFQSAEERVVHVESHRRQIQMVSKTTPSKEEMMKACFPMIDSMKKVVQIVKKKVGLKHRSPSNFLSIACNRIFAKNTSKGAIKCAVCDRSVSIFKKHGPTPRSSAIISHACMHLDKKLFGCRHCDHKTTTRDKIGEHVRKDHGLDTAVGQFRDFTSAYRQDVVHALQKCFGGKSEDNARAALSEKNTGADAGDSTTMAKDTGSNGNGSENSAKNQAKRAGNAVSLHVVQYTKCSELIQKAKQESGTIHCRRCSKEIAVTSVTSNINASAWNHALVHLKAPVVRCRICSATRYCMKYMGAHIRRAHALGMKGNYEDLSGEYHAEIMEMITQCYD